MANSNYLFVYGTLKPKSGLLEKLGLNYKIVGQGFVEGIEIKDTDYPALVPSLKNDKQLILGEIIELKEPEDSFKKLDEYEEFNPKDKQNSLYIRKKTKVKFKNGKSTACWIYWFNLKKILVST